MENHDPKTILLVEDEAIIAMDERVVIENNGFQVVTAHNGERAVELVQTRPDIDLILMDIDLGRGIDGTQAAAQILEFRELPIVFMTSHAEKEMVEKVKQITRYGYVLKYAGEFVLIEAVNMAFELFEANQTAQAENLKLEASERKFRTMYQFSQTGISRVGLDFKIEQANGAYCRMLGYSEAELIGKSISDITHPDDLPENLKKQDRLARGEIESYAMEKRFVHKDGHPVHGLLNASLVRDNEGNPEYFLGNVVDITGRKQAEKTLKAHEKFNEAILDSITAHLAVLDRDGVIIAVNEAWRKFAVENDGAPGAGLGENYFAICDRVRGKCSEGAAEIARGLRAVLTGEKAGFSMEYPCHSPSEKRWFLMNAVPLRSGEGGLVVAHVNVTEHILTDKQVKQNRRALRALIDAALDSALLIKPDGEIIECNQTVANRFGKERRRLIGTNAFDLVSPDVAKYRRAWVAKALATGGSVQFEDVRHGRNIIHSVNPVLNERGEAEAVAIFGADITEQKQTELALRESKEKYELLSENSTDIIAYMDHEFKLKYVSPACLQLTGYTPAELMPISIFDFIHPDDRDRLYHSIMTDVANKVKSSINTFRVRHKNGRTIWIESVSNRFFDAAGNLQCTIVNERDITDRKQAEEKIQALLKEKDLLLREIHHRIKNDMSVISSILHLQAATSDSPDAVQAMTEARNRIKVLGSIYEKLFSDEDFRKIQLQPFLNDLIADVTRTRAAPRISVVTDIEAMDVSAKQSFHLGIIINELVTNACKNAFPDRDDGKISVTVRRLDNKLEIEVNDNGVGFAKEIAESGSNGFGLTLINTLISQYRGSMEIDSENGTTVKILLNYSA